MIVYIQSMPGPPAFHQSITYLSATLGVTARHMTLPDGTAQEPDSFRSIVSLFNDFLRAVVPMHGDHTKKCLHGTGC